MLPVHMSILLTFLSLGKYYKFFSVQILFIDMSIPNVGIWFHLTIIYKKAFDIKQQKTENHPYNHTTKLLRGLVFIVTPIKYNCSFSLLFHFIFKRAEGDISAFLPQIVS